MNSIKRLFDFLALQQQKFPKPDMLAAKENGNWIKYSTSQVAAMVDQLSAGLLRSGLSVNADSVAAKEKIAIISRNRPEWIMLDLACQQIGAILCPIYPTTNVHELEFIFNDASIKYVFISGEEILEKVHSIKDRVPSLQAIYGFDELPGIQNWQVLLKDITEKELGQVALVKKQIDEFSCATIIYTSGTTGKPKGVMLSHHNIVSNVLNSKSTFPFDDEKEARSLSFLPLNHIFERMVTYIYICSGISIYYAQSLDTIGEDLKEVKPQLFCTVPRLLEKVYEKIMAKGAEQTGIKKKLFYWAVGLAEKYDAQNKGSLSYRLQLALANKIVFSKWREGLGNHIKFIVTGGAACQVRLLRIFTGAGVPIYEGYGPTENSPVISVNCRKEGGTKFGTVGLPLDGQEVILQPDGEICVKGPSVMMGYYKRPDLTRETIIDGWLYTGDIGVFEGKFLKITDRKKELFKTSGGKYVAPQPIENKMKESPLVEQMMVVGADHKFVGALIVPAVPSLREWMRQQNIPFTNIEEAIHLPQVLNLYKDLVDAFNSYFNNVEQVKKFELLPHEWTIDTGELTPTLKLKRKVIMEKYKDAIERIYQG
ncbi:MAG: AMP-dependent synthetase [Niastella sp. SCN 39-18]|nr:long-chain fatty acid--CoA ligase [Sphingobacteriales bacterium]ODT53690.1 MAG: AMP-dependent synthetase [Niastella sp. SCN 39-18]OJW09298.1 MAG: long-chain fatty acid--CoA ligase [Sphingobacteriales bacterium 39-19]